MAADLKTQIVTNILAVTSLFCSPSELIITEFESWKAIWKWNRAWRRTKGEYQTVLTKEGAFGFGCRQKATATDFLEKMDGHVLAREPPAVRAGAYW